MKKIFAVYFIVLLSIIYLNCEIDDTKDPFIVGWWELTSIKTVSAEGTERIQESPFTTEGNDSDGDGEDESIKFRGYMNINRYKDKMNSQIYMYILGAGGPDEDYAGKPKENTVIHCQEMDSRFTLDNDIITYYEGGPEAGTASYTYSDGIIVIGYYHSDGEYEEWTMEKLGAAPLSASNASDQSCGN